MGLYSGSNTWHDDVYQFDQTDPVQGGPNGLDNKPLKELADRTAWLKSRMGALDGDILITGSGPLDFTGQSRLITLKANGILNLQLGAVADFKEGAIVPITSFAEANSVANIKPFAGEQIYDAAGPLDIMHMHNHEHLYLVACLTHWKVLTAVGNFYSVGEEVKARKELNNTLKMNGRLLQRDFYPRLTKFVLSLTDGQERVSEYNWNAYGDTYKGCFTDGDGVSTIRIPDERGMFERMLDGGRGIDTYREHNFAGGYEGDDNKAHTHPYMDRYFSEAISDVPNKIALPPNYNKGIGSGKSDNDNYWAYFINDNTGSAGTESRPKNIGKLNLIKF